jgi:hypothetical protein
MRWARAVTGRRRAAPGSDQAELPAREPWEPSRGVLIAVLVVLEVLWLAALLLLAAWALRSV